MIAELIVWLRHQLDREETAAITIPGGGECPGRWTAHRIPDGDWAEIRHHVAYYSDHLGGDALGERVETGETETVGLTMWGRNEDEHVTRYSPAHIMVEIAAKRAIVDWCAEVIGDRNLTGYGRPGALGNDPAALAITLAAETLRHLAQPYTNQPGYQPQWTPGTKP